MNNQTWDALEIFGNQNSRDSFMAYLGNLILGCEDKEDSSIIYFNGDDITAVNQILNKTKNIDKWQWSKIKEENWIQMCKDFFKPIIINKEVQILPHWESDTSDYLTIKINPALAFGTGHHETTYMMIEAILNYDFNNKSIFDIGTGSGILSILAKKKGAKNIRAIDYDKLTYNNFHENLELNDVNDIQFEIRSCFDVSNFDYDFVFANINLNVLLKLIPKINRKGTILILSGILCSDKDMILDILDKQKIKKIYKRNEWLCYVVEL